MRLQPGASPSAAPVVRLLGGFSIEFPGKPGGGLSYEKGRALLARLAADPAHAVARKTLAALLWPDHSARAALANLRVVLLDLRQKLNGVGHSCISADREWIRLHPAGFAAIDVVAFAESLPPCSCSRMATRCGRCLALMAERIEQYRGEFLAGFSLPDCPGFEEWVQLERRAMHRRALELLTGLSEGYEQGGDPARGGDYSLRYLDLAPWDEAGCRRAMRQLALSHQVGSALAIYDHCRRALLEEFGCAPCGETQELAERISRGGGEIAVAGEVRMTADAPAIAERRLVTVLYCEISARGGADPDELLELFAPVRERCLQMVVRHAGHAVETHIGGVLAYFGYPVAREGAAADAACAALAMLRFADDAVGMRVGIHSGEVICGGSHTVPDLVGTTTLAAIRLRLAVPFGTVAISAASRLLLGDRFDCRPLPRPQGSADQPGKYHLVAAREERTSFSTPLTGRRRELAVLSRLWHDAQQGRRCHVLIVGEPGIGKSRLAHAFIQQLTAAGDATYLIRCVAEHARSPFHPLLDFFVNRPPGTRRRTSGVTTRALADLAALTQSGERPAPVPAVRRERLLANLPGLLLGLAGRAPALLIVEDLHWADPSTVEALSRLVAHPGEAPLFCLFLARPEFVPPWPESQVRMLPLAGLDKTGLARIVRRCNPELPAATVGRLVERADGMPLFAEALASMAGPGDEDMPLTLRDLLAARLDALGAAKATAQFAAVIGRSFSRAVLRRVSPLGDEALAEALAGLEQAGMIERVRPAEFRFRHALMRDAAYRSLARATRQAAHLLVAVALCESDPAYAKKCPAVLADHYAAGGDMRQAAGHWLAAGQLASRQAAHREALAHYRSGLELLDRLPHGPARNRLEFDLQCGLGLTLSALEGYASAAAAQAQARALALCENHPDSPAMFRALWGVWASLGSLAGYERAAEFAARLCAAAEAGGDPVHVQQGSFALGNARFWQGDFVAARERLESVLASYRPRHRSAHIARFGEDVGVTARAYLSWVLEALGLPLEARRESEAAVADARRGGHPFTLAYALTFAALLRCRLGDTDKAQELADEVLALADAREYRLWHLGARVATGWVRALRGDPQGAEIIAACGADLEAAMKGVELVILGPLAAAKCRLGQESALASVDAALRVGKALGDRHLEAELLCLKGDALLLADPRRPSVTRQAATCYRQGLALARRQQANAVIARAERSLLLLDDGGAPTSVHRTHP